MFESGPELPGGPDEGAAADEVEVVVDDAMRLGMVCARPVDSGLLCDLDRIELATLTADEAVTYLQLDAAVPVVCGGGWRRGRGMR